MKFQIRWIYAAALALSVGGVQAEAENKVKLDTDAAKLGYTVGVGVMTDIMRSGMSADVDIDALLAAQRDVFTNAKLQLSPEEMQQAQQNYVVKKQQEYKELADKNKAASEAFIAKVKSEKGVTTTDSGLLYTVEREGKGKQPGENDRVKVHYLGTLADGTPFDSSYQRNQPSEFAVAGVIPGFSEGLQLMKEGGKSRFVIPAELAYGVQAPAAIGPNQVLIFEVELIEVLGASGDKPAEKKAQ